MIIYNLCSKLKAEKIEFAIAGGVAMALHKIPRMTFDIDLVIHITLVNFEKFESVMHSLGLISRLPVSAKEVFNFRKEFIEKRNLVAWSFYNPSQPSEIVDVIITEDLKDYKKIIIDVGSDTVPVLDIESLIKTKEKANRPQDIEDIKWLKKKIHK